MITPASQKKRGGTHQEGHGSKRLHSNQKQKQPDHKKIRMASTSMSTSASSSASVTTLDATTHFDKLDPSNPQQKHKMQQRLKAIHKGKNTPGYHAYRKTVDCRERMPRSMITPSTPDHTLDIPNKRWEGMVKSWRKALHHYDPPELSEAPQTPPRPVAPPLDDHADMGTPVSIHSAPSTPPIHGRSDVILEEHGTAYTNSMAHWGDMSSDDDDDELL